MVLLVVCVTVRLVVADVVVVCVDVAVTVAVLVSLVDRDVVWD